MKKSRNIILSVLLAVCAVCLCFALVGCGKKDDDKDVAKYGYGEEGFYYYDGADSSRYMLSLQSGTYMITVNNSTAYSGSYSYDEESGKVSFSGDNTFAATLGESALSLDIEGSGYSFKAFKYFDVSYVDGNGNVVYTDSVLNGQSPVSVSGENLKDGYWFIDWYADSSNSAVYSFDTSIAGDTVIYGWFIEKNTQVVEHTVTLDYGDGYTETTTTMNGTIYKDLPSTYDGQTIIGWWVSATNKEEELTYKYVAGGAFDSDTTLFAVYAGLGSSVTADGITWSTSGAGSNVTITVYDENGKQVLTSTVSSTSGSFTSSAFTALEAGTYTVEIVSGSITETRIYVVNGLARVSLSESDIIVNGSGRVISFAPVDGADGYKITVSNGEKTVTEDLGSHTYYNFSDWEMTKEGITFVVTAYADGYADSVSDGFTYLLVLGSVTVDISDDTVSWNWVEGALEYVVTITDVDGNVIDSFRTSDTSFSLKYYENGTYDITVQPHTDGYYSEAKNYYGYSKDSLKAPQITDVTSAGISWENVGADSYVVLINGTEYTTTDTTLYFSDTSLPKSTDGKYEISVKAVKTGGSDSPYSDVIIATEEFSSAVSYDKNTIYWNYDIAAAYYGVSVNGAEETKTEGGHSFKVTLTKAGDNVITVTAYDGSDVSLGSAEITVYAYSVILDPNSATLVNDAADENGTIYVAQGDELNLGVVEKDYADFVGWYTQADYTEGQSDTYEGKGTLVEVGSTFTGSGSMYLYAYWTYQYLDVTLDVGSGTLVDESGNAITSIKIKYNSTTYVLPTPAAASQTDDFIGWYSQSGGEGERYTSETGKAKAVFDGTVELYAFYLTLRSYQRTTYGGQTVYAVSATAAVQQNYIREMTVPEYYTSEGKNYNLVINTGAFESCTTLEILNIPDTVLFISITNDGYRVGTGAFEGCSSLKEVNVYATGDEPDSTKEVVYFSEDGVLFHRLAETDEVELIYYPYGRELCAYTIPSYVSNEYECTVDGAPVRHAVTTLPMRVFRNKKIYEITVPTTITSIGSQAFYGNTEIKSVIFEKGGTEELTIGDGAFKGCSSISEITLPARYTDFNVSVFVDCTGLVNVYIEDGGMYTSDNGILLDLSGTTIVFFPTGRSGDVVLEGLTSGSITKIGDSAFASNKKITSVTISSRIIEIGESAFEGCIGLTSVIFDGNDISGNLTIKSRAFYGCILLSSVKLPSNLVTLEADAFGGCSNLTYVYYDSRVNADENSLSFSSGAFGSVNYITTLVLGPNVPDIDFVGIFEGGHLAEVIIEEGNKCFSSDEYGVVYNASMTTIRYYPLNRVGSYTVYEDTTTIGSDIFAGRVGLTSIEIGEYVNFIGDDAFSGCTYLESIEVDEGNTTYGSDENGILYAKDVTTGDFVGLIYCPLACEAIEIEVAETVVSTSKNAFKNNTNIVKVTFETESEFKLAPYTFYGCTSLVTVVLPDNMTSIPEYAFYNCTYLGDISIPSGVTSIGQYAFWTCSTLTGDLTDSNGIVLPEGLTTVSAYAFYYCKKLAVRIPSTVTTIGAYAFYYCWDDKSAEAPIEFEKSEGNEVYLTIGDYGFGWTAYATSVEIPARLVSAGDYAFTRIGSSTGTASGGGGLTPMPSRIQEYVVSLDPTPSDDDESESVETSITFEKGCQLYELSYRMFYGATKVKTIEIPDNIQIIDDGAFWGCSGLAEVKFGSGSELCWIGYQAFYNTAVKSISIPKDVYYIDGSAFSGASSLESVTFLGNDLETIGESAFYSCSALKSITLPSSLTSIGASAFYQCTSLTDVTFQGNGVTKLAKQCFYKCTSLVNVTLPTELAQLGSGTNGQAFQGCTALVTITIPQTVTNINIRTFDGCTSLTTVGFETDSDGKCSLEEIGEKAFTGCTALTSFEFPVSTSSSITLGSQIFDGSGVTTVTLSESITDIASAFIGLKLNAITVSDDHPAYMVDSTKKVLYSKDEKCIAYMFGEIEGEIEIADTIETIGSSAFYGQEKMTSVSLPASISEIGSNAFRDCTVLTSVTVRGDATYTLGDYAFYGCESLTQIDLPADLTTLPQYCFYKCDLSQTTIPSSITYIDSYALSYTEIDSIDLPLIEYIGEHAFEYAESLVTVKLGESLATLSSYAFAYCSLLANINLPDGLIFINTQTFRGCGALTSVTIPERVTTIDGNAFRDCVLLEEVILPSTLQTLGLSAFYGCESLGSIELPQELATLDSYVFYHCYALTNIVLPESLTSIGYQCFYGSGLVSIEMNDALTSIGEMAFSNCKSLRTVSIGSGVTSVASNAFSSCTALVYAYTGDSLVALSSSMFNGCTALETVEFGPSLATIGGNAFSGCTALKEIDFGNVLNTIESLAFQNCTSLDTVFIPSTVSNVAATAFSGCSCDIYVENTVNYVTTYWTSDWDGSSDVTVYYYTQIEPALNEDETGYDGNFWYYDGDMNIVVWQLQ